MVFSRGLHLIWVRVGRPVSTKKADTNPSPALLPLGAKKLRRIDSLDGQIRAKRYLACGTTKY